MENGRYQMRKAAGLYWLLDMKQAGVPYRKPIPLNESGAGIWEALACGSDQKEIAQTMSKRYGISMEEALGDVTDFIKQLKMQGVML